MAGNKNSGRRPRDEGSVTETTRTVVRQKNPIVAALTEALDDAADMDLNSYLTAAFEAGAAQIWIYRIVPGGEEYKVSTITPEQPIPGDPELYLLDKCGGPGTFLFTPAIASDYGGFIKPKGIKSKRLRIGTANEGDAGMFTGFGTDLDSRMSRLLAREEKMHALHQIQDLNTKWDDKGGPKKEDDVKTEELSVLLQTMQKSSDNMMMLVMKQHDLEIARINASVSRNPLDSLGPILTPLLGFLDKKLTPGTVTKWLAAFKENPAGATEDGGFWPSLFGAVKEFMPYAQPFLAEVMQKVQPQPTQPGPVTQVPLRLVQPVNRAPGPTTGPAPEGGEDVERVYPDKDTKDVLDFAIQCIDEGNYADAFASLRSCEDTMDVFAKIAPGASPQSFFFTFRELDPRLRERKDACCNFIEYVQKCITALQEEMAAQAKKKAEEEQGPPPAAA